MMNQYELQKLRDLPIEEVAERLGLEVKGHKCLCPFHDDRHPSLSFKVSKNTFRCFVCGESGGPIDLVMKYLHKDFLDACRWLDGNEELRMKNEELGMKNEELRMKNEELRMKNEELRMKNGQAERGFDASRYLRFFEHPWLSPEARRFLFEERMLDPRVVNWCRLTSWRDKQGVAWLQIPYYDQEGKLVGIQNRNLVKGALPRFRFPQGAKCTIYNLPVLNMLRPGDTLFIAEGCSDCWSLLSAGHKAIAIPSATLLTKADKELLMALDGERNTRFHMYPDRDEPGERLFLQLQQVLPNLVHHQLPPDCKDFSDYYLKITQREGLARRPEGESQPSLLCKRKEAEHG